MSARSKNNSGSIKSKANNNKLSLAFGGYSCAGKKKQNQDAFSAFIPNNSEVLSKGIIATIADGVSSASKAAEESKILWPE